MSPRRNAERRPGKVSVGLVLRMLVAGMALSPAAVLAQLPQARLQALFPAGGQRGTTVEISQAVGTDLDKATELVFSHPWFKTELKYQTVDKRQQPQYGNWKVTIPAGLPLGIYDVRVGGALGLSNPRSFVVGDLAEVREVEPNNVRAKAGPLAINQTLNGKMDAGTDIDWFKFVGKKGQRLIIECLAHRIDSRMSPIVELHFGPRRLAVGRNEEHGEPLLDVTLPDDGEYYLKVFDFVYSSGPEYFYRLSVHDKPHVDFIVPASGLPGSTGEYTLYGRNLPGGQPSEFSSGKNPLQRVKVTVPISGNPLQLEGAEPIMSAAAGTDSFVYSWKSPNGDASPVTIHYAAAPTAAEIEPNDTPQEVQKVTAPVEITGRFQKISDTDRYQFEAKKGETFIVEVFAERDASIADPVLVVERIRYNRKKGVPDEEVVQRITQQDDNNQSIGANLFDTASDDPQFRLAIPEDGTYRVVLTDRYSDSRGDPLLQYRLSIRREQPDFRLVALTPVPMQDQGQTMNLWELGLRQGDNATLQVMAFRRDGMNDPIELSIEGLPPGVTCAGGTIIPGQTQTTLFLVASETAARWSGEIRVLGRAAGKTRQARGGTILFNNGQGRRKRSVSRVMQAVVLSVQDQLAPFQVKSDVQQVTVNQGQQLLVPVQIIKRYGFDADLPLQFVNPPPNVQVENKPIKKATPRETLKVTINNNTPPGRYLFTLRAAAPVNYRFHLKEFERAQSEKTAGEKPYAAVTAEFKKAQEKKTAADKKLKDASEVVRKAELARKEAETAIKAADDKAKAAADELQTTVKKLKQAEDLAQTAAGENQLVVAKVQEADAKLKELRNSAVDLELQIKNNPKDKVLADSMSSIKKDLAQAMEALAKAQAETARPAQLLKERLALIDPLKVTAEAASKKFNGFRDAVEKAKQAAIGLREKQEAAAKEVATATTDKKSVDEEFTLAQNKMQQAEAIKKELERRFNEANTAARTQQFQTFFPVTVIDLTVKQALANLQLKLSASNNVKRGESLTVPVHVNRVNGFKGPVKLSLVTPPGVTGLTAAEVSIPADKSDGTLVIQTTPQATQGQIAYLIIRGSGDFQGPAATDVPVNLTVLP